MDFQLSAICESEPDPETNGGDQTAQKGDLYRAAAACGEKIGKQTDDAPADAGTDDEKTSVPFWGENESNGSKSKV